MITFEKVKALKAIYKKAFKSFQLQIFERPFNMADQEEIFRFDYVTAFVDEFDTVLFNNLSNRTQLRSYIERVYYEDIVWLYIGLSQLSENYYKENGKDENLFNRMSVYCGGLNNVANKVYSETKKHGIINLKNYLQIDISEYNLRGQYIDLLKRSIKIDPASNKNPLLLSYKWLGKLEDLPKLFSMMKDGLISNESRLSDFKSIFLNKDIAMINPIKWHDNNASELLYFINQLAENGLIKGKRLNYIVLSNCFFKSDGKKFTANFKNLLQTISVKLTASKKDKIDAIVKSFA